MEKRIKKEIEKQLKNPTGAFKALIAAYAESVKGTEKAVILRRFYKERLGFFACMRELNRCGFWLEKTTFYRIKCDIVTDVALRACYDHLICPYSDEPQQK